MNAVEIVIVVLLCAAVFLALRHLYRSRKQGCSCGCSGGCAGGCAACGEKSTKKK